MKHVNYAMLWFLTVMLSSCEAIVTIFKGGVWTGVILVVIVVVGVLALFSRRGNKE